jgi:hypothetical protein
MWRQPRVSQAQLERAGDSTPDQRDEQGCSSGMMKMTIDTEDRVSVEEDMKRKGGKEDVVTEKITKGTGKGEDAGDRSQPETMERESKDGNGCGAKPNEAEAGKERLDNSQESRGDMEIGQGGELGTASIQEHGEGCEMGQDQQQETKEDDIAEELTITEGGATFNEPQQMEIMQTKEVQSQHVESSAHENNINF